VEAEVVWRLFEGLQHVLSVGLQPFHDRSVMQMTMWANKDQKRYRSLSFQNQHHTGLRIILACDHGKKSQKICV